MAFILANGRQQYFDDSGNPLNGGKLWTMQPGAGVTTPKATWTDAAETALNTNPIVLNARGEAQVFWSGNYNVRLETASGGLIYTVENIAGTSGTIDTISALAFGAVGNGTADDWAAITAALAEAASRTNGAGVWLDPGYTFRVSKRLVVPSKCGLFSDGTGTLSASWADFTNSDAGSPARYSDTAVVVDLSGLLAAPFTRADAPFCTGIRIKFTRAPDGRRNYVNAIIARNCKGVRITENEIDNFPVSQGIKCATWNGGWICNNRVHDFYDNNDWTAFGGPTAGQITGIELDNDLVNTTPSNGVSICENEVSNMVIGPVSLAANGYQSDGINITKSTTIGTIITDNYINGTGEGIDNFGSQGIISGNHIVASYNFAIKIIHGATGNIVTNNTIRNTGISGIIVTAGLAGSVTSTGYNIIKGNNIRTVDYLGVWVATASTSGIQIREDVGAVFPTEYNVTTDNLINGGPNCKYGYLDDSTRALAKGYNSASENRIFDVSNADYLVVFPATANATVRAYGKTDYTTRSDQPYPSVAAANTMTFVSSKNFVTAAAPTVIKTINVPPWAVGGGIVEMIPDFAWTMDTSGNIGVNVTAVPLRTLTMTYAPVQNKWYPSYT